MADENYGLRINFDMQNEVFPIYLQFYEVGALSKDYSRTIYTQQESGRMLPLQNLLIFSFRKYVMVHPVEVAGNSIHLTSIIVLLMPYCPISRCSRLLRTGTMLSVLAFSQ